MFKFGFEYFNLSPRAGGAPPVPIANPSGFALSAPYQPTISRTGSGTSSIFTTDYSEATRKALITPVNTYYVSLTTGNNNNTGLSAGAAVRSLDLAVRLANASGVPAKIVYEAAPLGSPRILYLQTNTQARSGQPTLNATYPDNWTNGARPTVDIIFEPSVVNGVADCLLNGAISHIATADPNIYRSTASPINSNLFDYTNLDEYGAPRRLVHMLATPADTAAPWPEMNALYDLYSGLPDRNGGTYATGIYYTNGTNSFIRLWDNRDPNTAIGLYNVSTATSGPVLEATTSDRRVYCKGLGFLGGSSGAMFLRGMSGFRFRADFVDCRFLGGNGLGALTMTIGGGTATDGVDVVAVRCAANGGNLDGFNAHHNCTLVTIDCIADWNGHSTAGTNNGHTIHETTKAIDVNGSYRNNQDRSVHHVHNARAWHLGTESGTRRGADGTDVSVPYANNGNGNTGTCLMWLDACRIFNGPAGAPQHTAEVWTDSTIYYANLPFTPGPNPAGWTGTFAAYTP